MYMLLFLLVSGAYYCLKMKRRKAKEKNYQVSLKYYLFEDKLTSALPVRRRIKKQCFIVGCLVTMNYPMNGRVAAGKTLAI